MSQSFVQRRFGVSAPRIFRYAVSTAILLVAYLVVAWAGLLLDASYTGVTPLWPSAGLGVALVWLYGWRYVPVIVLGEIGIAMYLGQGLAQGVLGAFTQLGEAAIASWLLRRAGVPIAFRRVRDVVLFLFLGAALPALATGAVGAGTLLVNGFIAPGDYFDSALTWSIGDVMGILIVTPLVIEWRHGWPYTATRTAIAWVAIMVATIVLAGAIMLLFDSPSGLFFCYCR